MTRILPAARAIGAAVALLAARGVSAQSAGEALSAAAQIDNIVDAGAGDVTIIRRNGQHIAAREYMYLSSGDRLSLRGSSAVVTLLVKGEGDPILIEAARQQAFTVGGPPPAPRLRWLSNLLARFDYLFATSPVPVVVTTTGRGDGTVPGKTVALASPIADDQLVPEGPQQVTLVWAGSAVEVRLADAAGRILNTVPVAAQQAVTLTLPGELTVADITLAGLDPGQSLHWTVRRAALPDANEAPSPTEKALWLSTDGPAQYRLYGYSRLKQLSADDFAARRLWDAARSGLLAPAPR